MAREPVDGFIQVSLLGHREGSGEWRVESGSRQVNGTRLAQKPWGPHFTECSYSNPRILELSAKSCIMTIILLR